MAQPGRRPTSRVLVSPDVAQIIDDAQMDVIVATRTRVSKTDVADAMIRYARRHMDDVVKALTAKEDTPDE